MSEKAWKYAERMVALEFCGPAGVRVVRHAGGRSKGSKDFGDVGIRLEAGPIIPPHGIRVDIKHRKSHGAFRYWRQAQKVAKTAGGHPALPGPIPVVALREHNSPRTLVVVDSKDLIRLGAYMAQVKADREAAG